MQEIMKELYQQHRQELAKTVQTWAGGQEGFFLYKLAQQDPKLAERLRKMIREDEQGFYLEIGEEPPTSLLEIVEEPPTSLDITDGLAGAIFALCSD